MRSLKSFVFTALFLLFGSSCVLAQPALSGVEREIVRYIDSNTDRATALLERVVNINSGSLNAEGVREVGRVFREEFDDLGFTSRWEDGAAFNRAGHLISTREGDGESDGLHFLLIGHLDTVFEPDSPFQAYKQLTDSTASGPGISDMKGGDVIIVEALRALRAVGALDRMTVTVVLIGDEESSGRPLDLARKALREAAEAADIAIAFENGDDRSDTAVIARRGFTGWKLEVKARAAHSSLIFREEIGYGAINETARILNSFVQELTGEQYLTFNPGVIVGGTTVDYDASRSRGNAFGKTNVIAEYTTVEGDLRTISLEQRESAKARMTEIVARHLPHTTATIIFADSYPPMAPSEGNRRLLAHLDQTSRDLGFGGVTAVDPGAAGAADVSFTTGLVEMALDGFGLLGDGAHTVDETVNLRMLPFQTKRTAVLMSRLAGREGS